MVVDTDSGDVCWIEADRMAREARVYSPENGGIELLESACIQRLMIEYGMQVMILALALVECFLGVGTLQRPYIPSTRSTRPFRRV